MNERKKEIKKGEEDDEDEEIRRNKNKTKTKTKNKNTHKVSTIQAISLPPVPTSGAGTSRPGPMKLRLISSAV